MSGTLSTPGVGMFFWWKFSFTLFVPIFGGTFISLRFFFSIMKNEIIILYQKGNYRFTIDYMQNLHGLFSWFEYNVFGYSTLVSLGEGEQAPSLFSGQTKGCRTDKNYFWGGTLFILWVWMTGRPHLLEAMNLPLQLIDLLGLMPCSIPVLTGLKKKIFLC